MINHSKSQQPAEKLKSFVKTIISGKFRKKKIIQLGLGAAIATSLALIVKNQKTGAAISDIQDEKPALSALPVIIPTVKYGFALDTFVVTESKIKSDQVFTKMLTQYGIGYKMADSLEKAAKNFYDFTKIQDGKPYLILSKEVAKGPDYFIFEPDAKRYILFNFKNTPSVKEVKREVTVKEMEVSGLVKNSLWESMTGSGLSYQLADKVEDALKYQFDLRHFQDGDQYKVIYDEELVEGKSVGNVKLKGVYLKDKHSEKPVYAFYYENKSEKGFYSKEGLPMKDGFLKSPVKSAHISSRYNLKRLHPILGYVRPHFGTDYAAETGTPIMSVADGVISEAAYTSGNGNYIKVKHVKPYETQYLHMSRFAKGIHKGTHVKQGETIGYVGQTGLATGPHVCFRLWKNGSQVDHLREKLPQTSMFDKSDLTKFKELSNALVAQLDKIPILSPEEMEKKKKELEILKGKP